MNFDRSPIFAYLEEDNIQRAYFRVRPLLTVDGDVQEEAVKLWPNEGCLRIVPDRNEQHTFKTRMRSLGSYCIVDLRNQPMEAGKIRTNKNFRPDKGEVNQYILYSDTVHELPENTFFQLWEGNAADFAALAEKSITPLFYIRQEDTLYGPVSKSTPASPSPAAEAAGVLYEIACPDGVSRLMLCIYESAEAQKPDACETSDVAPAADHSEPVAPVSAAVSPDQANNATESLPIGETLHILADHTNHEETLKKLDKPVSSSANLLHRVHQPVTPMPEIKHEPLSGTPLVKKPLHMALQQTKNRTQEVVSSQLSVGKYEPPVQNLPAGAVLRSVENPVEATQSYLRMAWNSAEARSKLTEFILSLDGAQAQLESKLCNGSTSTVMQRVLRDKLQDLEAERLTALCERDKAHRDLDAYKQELLTGLSSRIAKETQQLMQDKSTAEHIVRSLKQEINALTLQKDALLDKINELQKAELPEAVAKLIAEAHMAIPTEGVPLRLSPIAGTETALDELLDRLMQVSSASGLEIDRNTAIALLVLLGVSSRIGVVCPTIAAVATLCQNIADAFGWQSSYAQQYAAEQRPLVGARPVDATPALLTTSLPNYAPINGVTKVMLNRSTVAMTRNEAYDMHQWPVLAMPALSFVPEIDLQEAIPVSAGSIQALGQKDAVSQAELEAVFAPVIKAAIPLSGAARTEMFRFASVCAGLMDGGLPVAVDWAILLWIIPALERGSEAHAAVKAVIDEYPLSCSQLA